jgi:hypothetical protein
MIPVSDAPRFGPWADNTTVEEFLYLTMGVTYANMPDHLALIPLIAEGLKKNHIHDLEDLRSPTTSALLLDGIFEAALASSGSSRESPGLLRFCMKRLGVRGVPFVPPSVPAPLAAAPLLTVTAETATADAMGISSVWGRNGIGGSSNQSNFPEAVRQRGSVLMWDGLDQRKLDRLAGVASRWSKTRRAGVQEILTLASLIPILN